ncbi:GNAT family N-acetyltransferase [Clostridium uliginosum]|nr:GNAT family N-acetyltransferase [Clostridium uliginosum]
MRYYCKDNALTAQIYILLRKKVDFKEYQEEDVNVALENSLYTVVIYDNNRPIGISRIVGDDRIVFFIKDVVVDPQYQKMGIGDLLMENMKTYIEKKACDGAYIGLMSTPNCVPFYKKHEFIERPSTGFGPGMIKFFDRNKVAK